MKSILFHLLILPVFLLLTISQVQGGTSPWKWEATLQTDSQEDGVMHLPVGLYVDKELERYYVVDGGNSRLVSFDRYGRYLSDFSANHSLLKPYALIREPGFLWIVEKGRNTLTGIDLQKKEVIPHTLTYEGKLLYPDRIARDGDILFVLDKASGRFFSLDRNLNIVASFGCQECRGGFVDFKIKNDMVWALSQQDNEVQQFTLGGGFVKRISLAQGKTEFPRSLALDDSENLYILDRHAGTVSVYDQTGDFKYKFLEPGNSRGQLYYPVKLQFDPWGRLCIVDEGNGRVQIYSKR